MKFFLLVFLTLSLYAQHTPLKKVSLQLLWLDQFQFAGYYMAKEKGFYKDAGFDVAFKKVDSSEDPMQDVIEGKTTYCIGRASLVRYDSKGKDIVFLATIFQSSPDVLLTLKSSGIEGVKEFSGKTLMQEKDLLQSASIAAMMSSRGVNPESIKRVENTYNIQDLVNKKVDIYSAYISNEPFLLDLQGVEYNMISPQKDGLDFFSDILYTSKKNSDTNHAEVAKFKEASLAGWSYAFSHIEESVDLILRKYNTQNKSRAALTYEAVALKKLAYFNTDTLGKINTQTLHRIYDIYKILGVASSSLDIDSLVFHTNQLLFTQEEKDYLKVHGAISFCTQPNALPYSSTTDGKFEGIGAGILELISQKTQLHFDLVPTKEWSESLKKAVNKECDILPLAAYAPSRAKYFNFTDSYYHEPIVIVTKSEENYILNVESVLDKQFSVVKGNAFIELLQNSYPSLNFVEVGSTAEGFALVEQGKVFGHIDIMMSSAYILQKLSKLTLKIAGQFPQNVKVAFAVRKDDPMLYSILNKTVQQLSTRDIQGILNKWVGINYTTKESIPYLREMIAFFLLVILFLFYKEYYLKKKNKELESLKSQLVLVNKQLETEVYDATKNLEKAQSIAKVGSWILDLQSEELQWSEETYRIFGVDAGLKEDLLEIFQSRIDPEDRESVSSSFRIAVAEKKEYLCNHKILLENGELKYVRERAQISYSKAGPPLLAYGTVQDITSSVLKEQEIKKKDKYLLHQSRLAQMGEMLSMIAHQWKQPLSAISSTEITLKTVIELEKYDLSKENERRDFLEFLDGKLDKIALYVQNLAQTIKDFSDFYKPGKESEYISLDSVILKANELIKDDFTVNKIELLFDLKTPRVVKLYENEFMQVVINLLTNAKEQLIEKEVEDAKIVLKSYEEDNLLVITVEDNAGGVPNDIIHSIFNPYFSTKLEKNGTGLGLYMCKMIISEYHDGDISVKNTEQGARFTIKLKTDEKK